uniref:Uncharacterized protein n=1 Tax=Arabidopsis thaliana TaxID=3702 RepID=Q0WP73_ARATH|nr:hypothetical protein [Arabidopsis thaliana]
MREREIGESLRSRFSRTVVATALPSFKRTLNTNPNTSLVILRASTTNTLLDFPKNASNTTTDIQITITAGTATAAAATIDMAPNTAPNTTDA